MGVAGLTKNKANSAQFGLAGAWAELGKNFGRKTFVVKKNFWSKNFLVREIVVKKKLWSRKFSEIFDTSQKILGLITWLPEEMKFQLWEGG